MGASGGRSNPRSIDKVPSAAATRHVIHVLGRTFMFEQVYPLLEQATEAHVREGARSAEARALTRALRYTCAPCSKSRVNAYHHSACAHVPTNDVLAARTRLLDLWIAMQGRTMN